MIIHSLFPLFSLKTNYTVVTIEGIITLNCTYAVLTHVCGQLFVYQLITASDNIIHFYCSYFSLFTATNETPLNYH